MEEVDDGLSCRFSFLDLSQCVTNKSNFSQNGAQMTPIVTFIIAIVDKGFNGIMLRAREIGVVRGFEVVPRGLIITQLQFVDHTLLCNVDMEEVSGVTAILRYFEIVSGLRVTLDKSGS